MKRNTSLMPVLLVVLALILSACSLPGLPALTPQPDATQMAKAVAQTVAARLDDAILATLSVQATQRAQSNPPAPVVIPTIQFTPTLIPPSPTTPSTLTPTSLAPTPVPTASPSATPTASPTPVIAITPLPGDPAVRLGNPTWKDNLDNARNWPVGSDDYTSATVENGFMHLTGLTNFVGWRIGTTPELNDFYLEAKFQSGDCNGADSYGVVFRVPVKKEPDQGYLFAASCAGRYSLKKWDGKAAPNGKMDNLINWKNSSSILIGVGRENRLGVLVLGSKITLYINSQQVDSFSDTSYSTGYIGVLIQAEQAGRPYTVLVDEVSYWKDLAGLSQ